jgi:hypothetical protein
MPNQNITLTFIAPLDLYKIEKPYAQEVVTSDEVPETNIETIQHNDIELTDLRDTDLKTLSYDRQASRFLEHHFDTEPNAVSNYCREMAKLVSQEFAADRTLCYDFRVSQMESLIFKYNFYFI